MNVSKRSSIYNILVKAEPLSLVSTAISIICLCTTLHSNHLQAREIHVVQESTQTSQKVSQQTALAALMIDFYKLLQQRNAIHRQLSGDRNWQADTAEERHETLRYMGLLEQIETWRRTGIISIETIDQQYGHRIAAIYNNNRLREQQLVNQRYRWEQLNRLIVELRSMPVFGRLTQVKENTPT